MIKLFKYSFLDLLKSRWTIISLLFYLLAAFGLLYVNDLSKAIISLMNIVLFLSPLTALMFGVIYFYNSRDFVELLLAQPVRRRDVFWGMYLGMAVSLSISFILGLGIPFLVYGVFVSSAIGNFAMLIAIGVVLTFIFSALAFWIAVKNENRTKGFGLALLVWLAMALLYDGIFLFLLIAFQEYPLENVAMGMTLLNPIDLMRITMMLKLDISALFGFTGAVINKFFGSPVGITVTLLCGFLWIIFPLFFLFRTVRRKDF